MKNNYQKPRIYRGGDSYWPLTVFISKITRSGCTKTYFIIKYNIPNTIVP